MKLDWKSVISDATDAALGAVKEKGAEVQSYLKQTAQAHAEALRQYGEALLQDQIDKETFESLMDDEKVVLHAELMAVQIMVKAAAHKAVNAFIESVSKAVKAALAAAIA